MLQKRFDDERDTSELTSETMRSAADSSGTGKTDSNEDEKMSLFWRVFGGTILSIAALGSITLYNAMSSSISELRGELNREREARAELVKKDEFNSRTSNQYERMRSFDGLKVEHEALKERFNANAAILDGVKKDSVGTTDAVKKDAAALELVKERLAALEVVKKDVAGIELLKERLAAVAVDLKTVRDEVTKLHQEIERNRAGDLERKTSRDCAVQAGRGCPQGAAERPADLPRETRPAGGCSTRHAGRGARSFRSMSPPAKTATPRRRTEDRSNFTLRRGPLTMAAWNGSTNTWPTPASARGASATRSSPPGASRWTASGSPTSACKIDPPTHQVAVDDHPVRAEKLVYWVVNKPVGYLCTNHDPGGPAAGRRPAAARRTARLHRRPARRGQRRPAADDQRRRPRDAAHAPAVRRAEDVPRARRRAGRPPTTCRSCSTASG